MTPQTALTALFTTYDGPGMSGHDYMILAALTAAAVTVWAATFLPATDTTTTAPAPAPTPRHRATPTTPEPAPHPHPHPGRHTDHGTTHRP